MAAAEILVTKAQVLQFLKALPIEDQWDLHQELLETLHSPPHDSPLRDPAFLALIDRRSNEIDSGAVKPIPWDEVKAEARAKLGIARND